MILVNFYLEVQSYFHDCMLVLSNNSAGKNKFHGLSPSGCHRSLLFDQGFQKIAGRWSERHLTVLCINEVVPSHVVIRLNEKVKIVVKCLIIATARLYNCLTSI